MAKPESNEVPRINELIDRFAGLPVKSNSGSTGAQGAPVCQMKIPQSCCAGKGYVLGVEGPVVKAAVCKCITGCLICQGQARRVIDGMSQLCASPSPRIVAGILSAAQLPARYVNANFQGFTNLSGNGRQVVARMQKWATQFTPSAGNGFLLGGSVGVGKTYLLVALAKALAARGFSVQFADFFQLLSELKAGYSDGKADPAMIAPLMACDVLIIDELGKGRNTEWERTIVDTLIQGRYNQRRPVVASTNYALAAEAAPANFNIDLERSTSSRSEFSPEVFGSLESRVGSRVFSRLRETMEFVELTGDDFRRRGALA
ncbi:MAG: cell division protein ZapE [Pseudomonadota bacterium]